MYNCDMQCPPRICVFAQNGKSDTSLAFSVHGSSPLLSPSPPAPSQHPRSRRRRRNRRLPLGCRSSSFLRRSILPNRRSAICSIPPMFPEGQIRCRLCSPILENLPFPLIHHVDVVLVKGCTDGKGFFCCNAALYVFLETDLVELFARNVVRLSGGEVWMVFEQPELVLNDAGEVEVGV